MTIEPILTADVKADEPEESVAIPTTQLLIAAKLEVSCYYRHILHEPLL